MMNTPSTSGPCTGSKYDVVYTTQGRASLMSLEDATQDRVRRKLDRIATCEFREPMEWDYETITGPVDGRFGIGAGLRALVDIDTEADVIRVRHVGHRENLYA